MRAVVARATMLWLCLSAWALAPSVALACSCRTHSVEAALLGAYVVAEVTVLEVGDPDPRDMGSGFEVQRIRVRLERIFKAPPGFRDGDEVLIQHEGCNSMPYDQAAIGGRYIGYFTSHEPWGLHSQYCSRTDDAWHALPFALIASRRAWLRRQQ